MLKIEPSEVGSMEGFKSSGVVKIKKKKIMGATGEARVILPTLTEIIDLTRKVRTFTKQAKLECPRFE